jgi:hypothetical protein
MDMTARYHMLTCDTGSHVMILDAQTGRVQHPACWRDISAYYHYLLGRGRKDEAQSLLAESMSGKKPITRMVEGVSGPVQACRSADPPARC